MILTKWTRINKGIVNHGAKTTGRRNGLPRPAFVGTINNTFIDRCYFTPSPCLGRKHKEILRLASLTCGAPGIGCRRCARHLLQTKLHLANKILFCPCYKKMVRLIGLNMYMNTTAKVYPWNIIIHGHALLLLVVDEQHGIQPIGRSSYAFGRITLIVKHMASVVIERWQHGTGFSRSYQLKGIERRIDRNRLVKNCCISHNTRSIPTHHGWDWLNKEDSKE